MTRQPITAYLVVFDAHDPPLLMSVHETREQAEYFCQLRHPNERARVFEVREVRKS